MNSADRRRSPADVADLSVPWVVQAGGDRVGTILGLTHFLGRRYLCGPAFTFHCAPNDNLAIHIALYRSKPGGILIGAGGGTTHGGLFGELMATEAVARGIGGLVVEGTVRDVSDLDRLGLPVLCAGTAPAQCAKAMVVSVGQPVEVGGVLVRPGDQVIADRDGAAVVPAQLWGEVRADASALAEKEAGYLRRLLTGERLADILGLDPQALRET
ncbi:MAG TPA: hypothetical protein VMW80_05815 [Candidatus Dormibacteraeota bacterium]|nr:hypothetical protein [Candidatus Dormibacteraeota bacterium]